jgi:hypothetical protein
MKKSQVNKEDPKKNPMSKTSPKINQKKNKIYQRKKIKKIP